MVADQRHQTFKEGGAHKLQLMLGVVGHIAIQRSKILGLLVHQMIAESLLLLQISSNSKLKSALRTPRPTPMAPTTTNTKEGLNFILNNFEENLILNDPEVVIIPRSANVFLNNVEQKTKFNFKLHLNLQRL